MTSSAVGGSTGSAPKRTFMLEDTNEGCYRDVSAALVGRGYTAVPFQRRANQKKKKAQFKYGVAPSFIWAINERDIDFAELLPFQTVNHFDGISKLTTKQGLCEILRGMPWVDESDRDISPRAYDLSIPSQRAEFADDFRLSAASNVLKHCSMKRNLAGITLFSERVVRLSIAAVTVYLAASLHGDWAGMLPHGQLGSLDRGDFGLLDGEWAEVLRASYDLAAADGLPEWCLGEIHQRDDFFLPSVTQLKIRLLLRGLHQAPVVSRGAGLKLCSKLEDIFELEKRIAGRIVQKYVETPLLVPKLPTYLNMNSNLSVQVKFDTRVWVAVTSFEPLKAYVYSTIYGRRCSRSYSTSVRTLGDDYIHLTNYSVQKNASANSTSASVQMSGSGSLARGARGEEDIPPAPSLVEKLRGAVKMPSSGEKRKASTGVNSSCGTDAKDNLLVTHDELLNFLDFKCNGKGREVWDLNVWPEVKRRIASLLKVSREHVTHRDKSFELLGVDVIFDDRLVPWILEANMSPGLSHRSDKHNCTIEHMIETLMQKILHEERTGGQPEVGVNSGSWEPLDTTNDKTTDDISSSCSDVLVRAERWTGIPVNIPNSRYHLISGEGKINKTWLGVLRSVSLSGPSATSRLTVAPTGSGSNVDDDESSVSEKSSYLRDKFSGLRNSSFLAETPIDDAASKEHSESEIIDAVSSAIRPVTVRPAPSESVDWSKGLRGGRPSSSGIGGAKGRFITTSKRDLLKASGVSGNSATSNMTPTEARLFNYNQANVQSDLSTFVVTGKSISKQSILAMDRGIVIVQKVLLLQRWARRYLCRARLYHESRRVAAVVLQCLARRVASKLLLTALVQKKAVIYVQSAMRKYLAGLETERRRKLRASSIIEREIFCYVIKTRKYMFYLNGRAKTVQRFLRRCMYRYFDTLASVIGKQARRWVDIRWGRRRVVRHLVALYYRRRVARAMLIKRSDIMKCFLKYLQTKRRRRKHMFRVLTTQGRKPNKGLRHVVSINIRHDIVVFDRGDAFSPLFKYNSVNSSGLNPSDTGGPEKEVVTETFPARKDPGDERTCNSFVPAASKALEIVNSIIQESEEVEKAKRDKAVLDDLLHVSRSHRAGMTCDKSSKKTDVFDILEFVTKHADGNGDSDSRDGSTYRDAPIKSNISFEFEDGCSSGLGMHRSVSPHEEGIVQPPLDNESSGGNRVIAISEEEKENSNMPTSDEEEDVLFHRSQSNERSRAVERPMHRNKNEAPVASALNNVSSDVGLTLDGFDEDSECSAPAGAVEYTAAHKGDPKRDHPPQRRHLRNQELDQPKLRQEYDVPKHLRIDYPPQYQEYKEDAHSPDLYNGFDDADDLIHEQEVKVRKSKSSTKLTNGPKKKKKKPPGNTETAKKRQFSNDPDDMYREQLEKQLGEAKAKYAAKQLRRQTDAYYRHSDIVRGDSAPFITTVKPTEPVWDTRNTSKGINTKNIEIEKAEAMCAGAQWDSEIQLLLEEKKRKRARSAAAEEKKKRASSTRPDRTSRADKAEITSRNEHDRSHNSVGLNAYAATSRKRPKSAGHANSRSRIHVANQLKSSGHREDPLGGYILGPDDATTERGAADSDFGSAYPVAPSSPAQSHLGAGRHGRPTRPSHPDRGADHASIEYAADGTINTRLQYNNLKSKLSNSAGAGPAPKTHRPKSAGLLGASGRRQAARGLNRSGADTASAANGIQNAQSESLWTATANKNAAVEFSAQDMSRIEEELNNVDMREDADDIPQQHNIYNVTHHTLDSDSDDDLEAAMAKWMKKQENKSMRFGERVRNKSVASSTFRGNANDVGFSGTMTDLFESSTAYTTSRFEFEERVRDRQLGPFEGADAAVKIVGSGISSQTAPGVKIPVAAHTHLQFRSVNELEKERSKRQFEKHNGYTPAFLEAAQLEEDRARRVATDRVPLDTYQTYTYDAAHRHAAAEENATYSGFGYSAPYYEENQRMGESVVSSKDNRAGGAFVDDTSVPSDRIASRKKRPPPPPSKKQTHAFDDSVDQGATNSNIYFPRGSFPSGPPDPVSHDPLQTTVQNFRAVYSGLTWDF